MSRKTARHSLRQLAREEILAGLWWLGMGVSGLVFIVAMLGLSLSILNLIIDRRIEYHRQQGTFHDDATAPGGAAAPE